MRPRVIPTIMIGNGCAVRTRQFADPTYAVDSINAVKSFKERGAGEPVIVDVAATYCGNIDDFLLANIATETLMPLAYDGGIHDVERDKRLLALGMEKVIFDAGLRTSSRLVSQIADQFGSQAAMASVDVSQSRWAHWPVVQGLERAPRGNDPVDGARGSNPRGAGEFILTAVRREGTAEDLDLGLIASVTPACLIPVVAQGVAGSTAHPQGAVQTDADAVAAGCSSTTGAQQRYSSATHRTPSLPSSFREVPCP